VQALAALQKAVELEPTYFKVYQELGSYYENRGDSRDAILQFEKSVSLAPNEPDPHYALGTNYMNAGRYAEAERELGAATALGEYPRALNNLAVALMYQGRDGEAIPLLVRALARYPERYLWWMNLGDAYRQTNSATKSAEAYGHGLYWAEQETQRDPHDGVVRARLAYMCARLGDHKRAEFETSQALSFSPESADARDTAVRTYEALIRRDDTLAVLRSSSDQVLEEALRRKDLADLHRDSRFQQLVASRHVK